MDYVTITESLSSLKNPIVKFDYLNGHCLDLFSIFKN